jgi:hypothetical protein
MNKPKLILSTISLFFVTLINAQKVEVTNGPQFLMAKSSEQIVDILNMDRDNFSFLTQKGKKTFKVMTLNDELNVKSTKDVELPEVKGKDVRYLSAGQLGENTYFYSQFFDKKVDAMNLYASDLNVSKGTFNQHYEAMSVNDDKFNMFGRPFTIQRSIDSTKVMFVAAYPTKGKEKAKYAIKVTDNKLNEVWKKDIIFKELDKNFTPISYLVDKQGNVHIAATIKMDKDEKKSKESKGKYYVSIFSYFHETGELKEYEIGFKNELIISANLELNQNNEIVCTGFYAENKLFDAGMKGFFFMRIDPITKEVVAKSLSPFDKKFLGELMSEKKAEKGKGLYNYLVRKTFPLADGGMAVVSEYYSYTYTQTQNGGATEIWVYGNVLVFFLDKDGNMKTYSILKKNQMCMSKSSGGAVQTNLFSSLMSELGLTLYPGVTELPYYGIATMMKDDHIYLVYNENPKNEARLKAGKNPRSVRQRTSVTMLVDFDPDGKIEGNVLFKSKDKDSGFKMPLMPRYHYNFSKDAMLIIGRKGKKARVTEIKIN